MFVHNRILDEQNSFFFPPSLSLSSFFPPVLAAACFFFERVSIQGGEAASSGMRQAQSCVTNWATPAQIMGVLFGERGNSFISFFQQSAAGQHGATATEGRGWIVQPRIKRNYIAFVSSDRKQLRVNKQCVCWMRAWEEVKTKGKKDGRRRKGWREGWREKRFNALDHRYQLIRAQHWFGN